MRRRHLLLLVKVFLGLQIISGVCYLAVDHDANKIKEALSKIQTVSKRKYSNVYKKIDGYTKRFDTFYSTCRKLGFADDANTTSIRAHISPNLKVLYCRVNKCASTLTLELLRRLFDCDTECLIKVAERVRLDKNSRKIMDDAFSFMIVREPYGRLFSTYCNIFFLPKEDWLYRGTKLIKLTRYNISYDSFMYGHDLTFAELIKYTVDTYEDGNRMDEHVRPMYHKSCNPCVFNFDYIAHLETLQADFDHIFNELRNEKVIESYEKDMITSLKNWTLIGPIKHLFRTIPLLKGSTISLYNIYLRAWRYYQITGHILKTIDFPFDKSVGLYIKKEDLITEIKNAIEVSAPNKSKLKAQRTEAMMQAYSTISNENMERLSKVVQGDCLLFGYEEKPTYLFDRTGYFNKTADFNYFKGL